MARESQHSRQKRVDAVALVKRGDKVPSFTIRDLDGNQFSTDQLRGKVVLLNFFTTWCGPCMKELPHIEEIWNANNHREDFALLVIDREESEQTAQEFKDAKGLSFPIAADPERAVYGLFAKELIPRSYLIDKAGTICFTSTGYVEEDIAALKNEIQTRVKAH
jgi:peroxiredoxin